jgi:hypothetical protein
MIALKKLLPCLAIAFLFCTNGFSQKAKPFNAASRPRNLADAALPEPAHRFGNSNNSMGIGLGRQRGI